MNNRTEAKLTDLSGMQKAIEEILKQAWKRGRKYGQNKGRPTGEWITICTLPVIRKCSLCGVEYSSDAILYGNFCSNCGADMREKEAEE